MFKSTEVQTYCFIWCQGVRKEVGVDEKCNQTFQHFHVCEHFCISESHQIDFNLQRWLFKGYVQSPLSSMLMESTEKFRSPQKIFGASQQNKHCSILLNYWSGSVQLSQGIAMIRKPWMPNWFDINFRRGACQHFYFRARFQLYKRLYKSIWRLRASGDFDDTEQTVIKKKHFSIFCCNSVFAVNLQKCFVDYKTLRDFQWAMRVSR